MLQKNQILNLQITDLNNLGYGVARADGQVVFVDGALVGETVSGKIIKCAKDYAVARVEQILSPSPDRMLPDCPVAKPCGGCCFRHLSEEGERRIKQGYVTSAFRKAGIPDARILSVVPSPLTNGYRNKVLYPVDENFNIGYYARHSHRIIPCDICLLSAPAFAPILSDLTAFFKSKRPSNLRHLYLRIAEATGEIMVCPVLSTSDAPWKEEMVRLLTEKHQNVKTILLNVNPTEGNVVLGKECILLYGDGTLTDRLCGLRFSISPLSFYQVNRGAAELLYEEALRRASLTSPSRIADLYCGTGTIGLILASRMKNATLKGVDIVPQAIENARFNAEANGIKNASFVCADSVGAEVEGMDCVILDPPRKGSSSELLYRIADAKVKRIVYVSCNPDTLARDAVILRSLGYGMGDVMPFDLFPRTSSIECVTDFTLEANENE